MRPTQAAPAARAAAGKVVLVTGASSGIGAATALEFARQGAHVVLAARREDKLREHAARIVEAGGRALALTADVTNVHDIAYVVDRATASFGPIDVLVNNAGVNWCEPLADTDACDVAQVLSVNLVGAVQVTRAVLPEMKRRRQGVVISVGSVAGHVALEPLYSASKFGVRGFSLGLRRQLAGSGIDVCLVTPGNIRTEMTSALDEDMPGPELVAQTIVSLAVHPRREVVVPSRYRGVIWLDRLVPGVADAAFRWRHRGDPDGNNLPAYAGRADGRST